jgi:hypothetical protein
MIQTSEMFLTVRRTFLLFFNNRILPTECFSKPDDGRRQVGLGTPCLTQPNEFAS